MTYNKWDIILGIHKHEAESRGYKWKSDNTLNYIERIKTDDTSPTYGIIYRPNSHMSIYASHSENFDAGSGVNTTFENFGDILPPLKTKQNEIGVKYKRNNLLYTLAYYDIKQDNLISVYKDGYVKPFQSKDGQARHKGLEFPSTADWPTSGIFWAASPICRRNRRRRRKERSTGSVSTELPNGLPFSDWNTIRMKRGVFWDAQSIQAKLRS